MITILAQTPDKHRLVNLLASYGIKEPLLSIFEEIPRDLFVEKQYLSSAWEDRALPTQFGQTISQPSLVALTLQSLNLKKEDKVLEIGTGSGFQAALLGKLVSQVYSLERFEELATRARQRIKKIGTGNVTIITRDGSEGYKEKSPYDVIIVTAAFHKVPQPLIDQLKVGGKLIMPIGPAQWQELILYTKAEGGLVQKRRISQVHFVPFVGKNAYTS